MPAYEAIFVLRAMKQEGTVAAMKRVGELLLNGGVVMRNIENLGLQRELPYKMTKHGKTHYMGSFVLFRYNAPTTFMDSVTPELQQDLDVLKFYTVKMPTFPEFKCTLEDELQVPANRPSVQKLIKTGARPSKPKYKGIIDGPF